MPIARHRTHALSALATLLALACAQSGCSDDAAGGSDDGAPAAADAGIDAAVTGGEDAAARGDGAANADPCQGRADGAACDDGDPCTQSLCAAGSCKVDADLCACRTTADCEARQSSVDALLGKCAPEIYCDRESVPYTCTENPGSIIKCSARADTACKVNACRPATGECALGPRPQTTACDDGDPCTANDRCDGKGACAAGSVAVCECTTDADCASKEDGNLCNGTLYCSKSAAPYTCKVNGATAVKCPDLDWQPCKQSTCAPATGLCTVGPAAEGQACSDGQPCTSGDVCKKGSCAPGTNTCVCTTNADCTKHDDGDLCNGVHYCDKSTGQCKPNPATAITCPSVDDTACVRNLCAAKTGTCAAVAVNVGGACEDGDPCTAGETCQQGACRGGIYTCPCKTDSDCVAKDDGDLCNGTLHCLVLPAGKQCALNPATAVVCPTVGDTVCRRNTCAPKTGKCGPVDQPDGGKCDADGNACTAVDSCKAGVCQADVNSCECQDTADCAKHEDGDVCNGTLYCDKAGSKPVCAVNPATLFACKTVDDTACIANTCAPKTGKCALLARPDNAVCDDGNPCTKADMCFAAKCVAGLNVCACKTTADCAAGEDGRVGTGALVCTAGKCAPAKTTPTCKPAADPCLLAWGDPDDGACKQSARPDGTPCGDKGEQKSCKGGSCTADAGVPTEKSCLLWSVSTLAGHANAGIVDGKGSKARFTSPCGLAVDAKGAVWTASRQSHRVRRTDPDGTVKTIAGSSATGFKDGKGDSASFLEPCGIAIDSAGDLFVSDRNNMRLRKVTPAGVVTTIAGKYPGFKDGQGTAASMYYPMGLAFGPGGVAVLADELNNALRLVDFKKSPALVTTLAGGGPNKKGSADGPGSAATFHAPSDVAWTGKHFAVADSKNHRIRRSTMSMTVSTLAGAKQGYKDGKDAMFNSPEFIASSHDGTLWVADTQNHRIRHIDATGVVSTIAGAPPNPASGVAFGFADGVGASARFSYPRGIAEAGKGKILLADGHNHRIRVLACVKWSN